MTETHYNKRGRKPQRNLASDPEVMEAFARVAIFSVEFQPSKIAKVLGVTDEAIRHHMRRIKKEEAKK